MLAAWQTSRCAAPFAASPAASAAIALTWSSGIPRIAAIAPTPTGTASCIYLPRLRTVRTASANVNVPAPHGPNTRPDCAGDEIRLQASLLKHAPCRHRRRQNRWLRDLGQFQFFFRTSKQSAESL